jgi:hypothetical protein
MVANTFTTEFSMAEARSASVERAAALGAEATIKVPANKQLLNANRLKVAVSNFRLLFSFN